MTDDILSRIRAHSASSPDASAHPPISLAEVAEAEAKLNFNLPELLRSVYSEIGDGGWKIGRGGRFLSARHVDEVYPLTILGQYEDHQAGAAYDGGMWQAGLLPFCSWGCGIYSCVDCADVGHPVFTSEYCEVKSEAFDLRGSLELWLSGQDILSFNGGARRAMRMTNPFSKKPTTVSGREKRDSRKGR